MYSVHAYFTAVTCQAFSVVFFYPVMVTILTFYCFDFEYNEAADLMTYMGGAFLVAMAGSFSGIFIGTLTND